VTDTITAAITAYILGVLLCKSKIFHPARMLFRLVFGMIPGVRLTLTRQTEMMTPALRDEDVEIESLAGYDFISCRLCTGFYISAVVSYDANLSLSSFLAVYGLSYFMAKLEQP